MFSSKNMRLIVIVNENMRLIVIENENVDVA
jgi:hypothetical protein